MDDSAQPLTVTDRSDPLIAYMTLTAISPGLFRGGVLVVDTDGKPVDFRCTSAIKPNAMQKILYGDTLTGHMAVSLCGQPLMDAMTCNPSVMVVGRPGLLDLRRETCASVLWVRRQSDMIPRNETAPASDEQELVASESGQFETVSISPHNAFAGDIDDGIPPIRLLASAIDPLEPFSRIEAALKWVQDKAGRS